MKKLYETPVVELSPLAGQDVIRTSPVELPPSQKL